MNGSPVVGAGAASATLGRVAAGGFARVVLAGLVLVLAAVVVTMSGGAGLGGKLGSLFGLHSTQGGMPATAVQVAAPAPVQRTSVVARETPRRLAGSAPRVRLRQRHPAATGPRRTQAPSQRPTPAPAPVQPPPPPVEVPKPPPPAPGGNVKQVVETVRKTTQPVVPAPAQPVVNPVVDQTTAAVDQACGLIGGCP
ncbi:MAG TPA: hypothetical protein VF066_11805 [Thermoleophilaceae bacterium]